ncbi:MAG: class I SAM-dependent methyltransferase [Methanobacteriota archaeon]|nr:MAG: class I SAM-dependent methyltransferase [Euryarchaeota archaeon]
MSKLDSLRERLRPSVERARHFSGWQLALYAPRDLDPPEPWKYELRATELLETAVSVIDMGTGGGEVFGDLCMTFQGRAVATEPWKVNAPVAAARLKPQGIAVVRCGSLLLPFRNGSFDLVLNRHEELEPAEVARVLSPGGTLLTQQVGRAWSQELRDFFPRMQDSGDLFTRYQAGLRDSGLRIVQAMTHDWRAAYRRFEDLVYVLCVAPWTIPDFDPLDRDLGALRKAEESLSTENGILLTESRFLIEARKE